MECPLCLTAQKIRPVAGPDHREYDHCINCRLIFTKSKYQLSKEEEKKRYTYHKNGKDNVEYVKFLNRAIEPALKFINKNGTGLDFGCGPNPTISEILKDHQINCENYDPFFFPKEPIGPYDFIFATECFEHFFFPAKEIATIDRLLKVRGILIVMTEQWKLLNDFKTWYYARDPTHVCFYSFDTFSFISKKVNYEIVYFDDNRVLIMMKSSIGN